MPDGEKNSHVGRATPRVDGPLKVTGKARYAAEYDAAGLLHGCIVHAGIARGRIKSIETARAMKVPGVVRILTHEERGGVAWFDVTWRDEVAPPGSPFRPLQSKEVQFADQPVAVVIAESWEAARDAASLVEVHYDVDHPATDFEAAIAKAYRPPRARSGVPRPPKPRGDADTALRGAPFSIETQYRLAPESHQPIEMFATTCVWEEGGGITLFDKTQGSQNVQGYIAKVFGLKPEKVRVVNAYVGGAFGSGLRPHAHVFCAVLASLELKRSVRIGLSRQEMFTVGYRPDTLHTISLACDREGRLQAIAHEAVAATSAHEDYQENVVNWSGLLYRCANVRLDYKLTRVDTCTPCDMRAPGAASGVTVLECAMDELAFTAGIDPLAFRRLNYAERDDNDNKEFTSKSLEACYREGGEAFGWSRRAAQPGVTREGGELVGWGMASAAWEASVMETQAKATLTAGGHLTVSVATSDIGTGTYTILTQVAADALGLPLDLVTVRIGDSDLPPAPVEGGSWTAASAGSAVQAACAALRKTLFGHARKMTNSPLKEVALEDAVFAGGRIAAKTDPARSVTIGEAMLAAEVSTIEESGKAAPDLKQMQKYTSYTHSAVFAEVRVDEELGVVRATRIVCAVAAGRILNPKTARSQILGGVVMGLGMALHEEVMMDHRLGRVVNHNLAEYHVPSHADIPEIEVIFVDEKDDKTSPIGVKGLGEIGIVGTAAAVANAIFHATGRRVREFPITIDKVMKAAPVVPVT